MTPTISNYTLFAHPLGHEIDIRWDIEDEITSNEKIYLFKRSTNDVTDEEVKSYIANPVRTSVAPGLFVFTNIEHYQREVKDFMVEDGNVYFYKIVIVNKNDKNDTSEISAANVILQGVNLDINVVDAKAHIVEGVKKILKGVAKQTNGNIMVYNEFPREVTEGAFVVVTRVSGEIAYQFWSGMSSDYGEGIIRGDMDTDVIQVMWEVQNSPSLRDKLTNIFRGTKKKLVRYCMHIDPGFVDVKVTITGDGYDGRIEGKHIVYGSMLINCLIDNQLITEGENELIKNINYEMGFNIEGV